MNNELRSLIYIPATPDQWREQVQLLRKKYEDSELWKRLGITVDEFKARLVPNEEEDKNRWHENIRKCVQANLEADFTLLEIATGLNLSIGDLRSIVEEPYVEYLAVMRKIQLLEELVMGRPLYHFDGRVLKWGKDLTTEQKKAMKNSEVFLLLDVDAKPYALISKDVYGVIRERKVK